MNVATWRIAPCVSSLTLLAQTVLAQPPEKAATTDGADAKPEVGADAGDVHQPDDPVVKDPSESGERAQGGEGGGGEPVEQVPAWGNPQDANAACKAGTACSLRGVCTAGEQGACVAASDDDCIASALCRREGKCRAYAGRCVAWWNEDCHRASACRERGACVAHRGSCVNPVEAGLARPPVHPECYKRCYETGRCHYDGDHCLAVSAADCAFSKECREDGDCYLDRKEGRCDAGKERNSKEAMVAGIVLSSVGGGLGIAGVVAMFFNFDVAIGFWVAGGTSALVGIPLAIWGGVRGETRKDVGASPAPHLVLAPGNASLLWRF